MAAPRSVIVVSEEEAVREDVAGVLEADGLSVEPAVGLADARKYLDDGRGDCLVLHAPSSPAPVTSAVDVLRRSHPALPVIVVGEPDDPVGLAAAVDGDGVGYVRAVGPALARRVRRATQGASVDRDLDDHRRLRRAALDVSGYLGSDASRNGVEEATYRALAALERYATVLVGRVDPDAGVIDVQFPKAGQIDPGALDAFLGEDAPSVLESVVDEGTIRVVSEADAFTRAVASGAEARQPRSRTLTTAVVPVPAGDRRPGVLVLSTNRPGGFDESERAVLDRLGRIVGAAIRDRGDDAGTDGAVAADRVLSGLRHDLGNALSIALAHLDLAREEGDPAAFDRVAAALSRMDRGLSAAAALQSRIDADPVSARDLEATARRAWERVDPADATLHVLDSRAIRANRDLLAEAFVALFWTAVGERGGTVRVGLLPEGFYVADDGPGTPPGERGRLAEPGDDGGPTNVHHLLVRAIADAHGWEATVDVSSAGGTRVDVTGVAWADAARPDAPGTSGTTG